VIAKDNHSEKTHRLDARRHGPLAESLQRSKINFRLLRQGLVQQQKSAKFVRHRRFHNHFVAQMDISHHSKHSVLVPGQSAWAASSAPALLAFSSPPPLSSCSVNAPLAGEPTVHVLNQSPRRPSKTSNGASRSIIFRPLIGPIRKGDVFRAE